MSASLQPACCLSGWLIALESTACAVHALACDVSGGQLRWAAAHASGIIVLFVHARFQRHKAHSYRQCVLQRVSRTAHAFVAIVLALIDVSTRS